LSTSKQCRPLQTRLISLGRPLTERGTLARAQLVLGAPHETLTSRRATPTNNEAPGSTQREGPCRPQRRSTRARFRRAAQSARGPAGLKSNELAGEHLHLNLVDALASGKVPSRAGPRLAQIEPGGCHVIRRHPFLRDFVRREVDLGDGTSSRSAPREEATEWISVRHRGERFGEVAIGAPLTLSPRAESRTRQSRLSMRPERRSAC
jgi:hypothetical protein